MANYGNAHFETTVIKDGDQWMPSVRSLVAATSCMNLGATVADDFSFIRLAHPRTVVLLIIEVAISIDFAVQDLPAAVAASAVETNFMPAVTAEDVRGHMEVLGGEDHEESDFSIHTHTDPPEIHIEFPGPIDGLHLSLEQAIEFAEAMRTQACALIAEEAAEGEKANGGAATEA